jgi:hypothetical protein
VFAIDQVTGIDLLLSEKQIYLRLIFEKGLVLREKVVRRGSYFATATVRNFAWGRKFLVKWVY